MNIDTYHSKVYEKYLSNYDKQKTYIASTYNRRSELYLCEYTDELFDECEVEQSFFISAIYVPVDVVSVRLKIKDGGDRICLEWFEGKEEPLEQILKEARELPREEPILMIEESSTLPHLDTKLFKPIKICDPFIYLTNFHRLIIDYHTSAYDRKCHIVFTRHLGVDYYIPYPYCSSVEYDSIWGDFHKIDNSKANIILRYHEDKTNKDLNRNHNVMLRATKPECLT